MCAAWRTLGYCLYNATHGGRYSQLFPSVGIFLAPTCSAMSDVTLIIERIRGGDAGATDDLLPIVYNELRRMAGRKLDAEADHLTIQTTELVHEAYLRLVGTDQSWDCRAHFLAAAAEAMRRILVERARRRQRIRHGGGLRRADFHESALEADAAPDEILVVNDLLDHLAEKHPIEAAVVKLHYFAGFNISEAARAVDIPVSTAHRHWNFARAWLYRRLKDRPDELSPD